MNKYLEQFFLKETEFDENILSNNLFISFDHISALRKEYLEVISLTKKYDRLEIVKSNIRDLGAGFQQGLFIVKLNDINLFLRLILSDSLITDVLIYSINDMEFINKVFFNTLELDVPQEFKEFLSLNKAVVIVLNENEKYKLLKANSNFYDYIKYEDWDFNNKYQNVLNTKLEGLLDLNELRIYRSDNKLIKIKTTYKVIDNIYCLIEE